MVCLRNSLSVFLLILLWIPSWSRIRCPQSWRHLWYLSVVPQSESVCGGMYGAVQIHLIEWLTVEYTREQRDIVYGVRGHGCRTSMGPCETSCFWSGLLQQLRRGEVTLTMLMCSEVWSFHSSPSQAWARTHTHSRTHTRSHVFSHTHTHTHTQTRTIVSTHSHTQNSCSLGFVTGKERMTLPGAPFQLARELSLPWSAWGLFKGNCFVLRLCRTRNHREVTYVARQPHMLLPHQTLGLTEWLAGFNGFKV